MTYKIKKPHITKNYARYRLQNPKLFRKSTFRTKDIGKKGHSKLIVGEKKSSGKYEPQSILISKSDYNKGVRVKEISGKPIIIK